MRKFLASVGCVLGSLFAAEPIPLIIAHRGASGYLPEHTLAAKALAYAQGADYLEQDVVLSKDGVPVVQHDVTLDSTTEPSGPRRTTDAAVSSQLVSMPRTLIDLVRAGRRR